MSRFRGAFCCGYLYRLTQKPLHRFTIQCIRRIQNVKSGSFSAQFSMLKRLAFRIMNNVGSPHVRSRVRFLAISIVAGLLFLLLLLDLNPGPNLAFASGPSLTPTPTIDRLAEPTLPAIPGQADLGAQDYWLNCMPCHGDVGQGLTDEFRLLYPEEDRNCWSGGCHGNRPYQNGFTLPTSVPHIIGSQALTHFTTAAGLHGFIKAAMPYQDPGSLDDEAYWRLTAFLLRENDLLHSVGTLGPDNAALVRINQQSTEAGATPASTGSSDEQEAVLTPGSTPQIQPGEAKSPYLVTVISLGLVLAGFLVLLLRSKSTPSV